MIFKKKSSRGITLIALVVTIIVLLILAGISIQMLTGDNGILVRAGQAKEAQERAQIEELLNLATLAGYDNKGQLNAKLVKENILKELPEAEVIGNSFPLIVKIKGYTYRIDGNGKAVAVNMTEDEINELVAGRGVYAKLYDINGDITLVIDNNPDFTYSEGTLIKTYTDENQEYMANHDNNGVVWGGEYKDIKKVIFNGKVYPDSTRNWFYNCKALKEIKNISNLNTKYVTDMTYMFGGCELLEEIDVSNFNTENVISFAAMFLNCKALQEIDLSSFNASNATDMTSMFNGCSSLTELDLRPLEDNKCNSAGSMISGCNSLEDLYLCTFQNITDMSFFMQNGMCNTNVKRIHAEDMNTANVTNMNGMFLGCNKAEEITFLYSDDNNFSSSFGTGKVTNMQNMFMNCESLKTVNLSFFDTSRVNSMNQMFMNCKALENIDFTYGIHEFSYFTTPALTSCSYMFYDCSSLEELDLGYFDTGLITGNSLTIFNDKCTSLTKLRVCDKVNWQTIQNLSSLQELTISPKMVNIPDGAFNGRTNLITINIENGIQTIGNAAFAGCTGLETISIPNGVTQIGANAFASCSKLEEITIPGSVTQIGNTPFGGCAKLRNVTILANITQLGSGIFAGCTELETVTIPNTVTQIGASAFGGCNSLTDIYFNGTTAQWNSITVGGYNDALTAATVHTTDNP